MFLQVQAEKPPLQPDILFHIFGWPITNTLIMIWLIIILLIIIFFKIRKFKTKPDSKFQHITEILYEGMHSFIGQLTGSKKHTKAIFPLIAAIFIFIGFSNLIGLIPLLTSITYKGAALFRTPTNDFNTTFSMALGVVILAQITSIRDWGLLGHLGKYFKFKEVYLGFKKSMTDGMTAIIDFFIGILDIVSEVAKTISLSLRLFGNMYAGNVLTVVIFSGLAYGLPSVWLAMNLLVAVVQTIVFGSLAAAYYMVAVKPEEVN
ncbi:MAG: FoF1 ATP synthase subunit a [Candidatus Kuenenbacteria bacterium]